MATYLTGPLLVLNPPFTKQLLQDLGAEGTLAFEEAAMEAYEARLAEFRDEKAQLSLLRLMTGITRNGWSSSAGWGILKNT